MRIIYRTTFIIIVIIMVYLLRVQNKIIDHTQTADPTQTDSAKSRLLYEKGIAFNDVHKDSAVFYLTLEVRKSTQIIELYKVMLEKEQAIKIGYLTIVTFIIAAILFFFNYRRQRNLHQKNQQILPQVQVPEEEESKSVVKVIALEEEVSIEETPKDFDIKQFFIEKLQLNLDPLNESEFLPHLKILNAEDWLHFRGVFESRFPGYISRLKEEFPYITNAEMRLFLLYKISFNSSDISNILGISTKSVYMTRYRLRKKLNLKKDDDFIDFIQYF